METENVSCENTSQHSANQDQSLGKDSQLPVTSEKVDILSLTGRDYDRFIRYGVTENQEKK